MSFLLELTRGQARVRQVAFHRGQPRPTVSIGRQAAWSLNADDLEDVHAFVSFDGAALMVRSADERNPVWLDGRAVPCAWTPLRAQSVLAMGTARVTVIAVDVPVEDEDEDEGPPPSDNEVTGQFDVSEPIPQRLQPHVLAPLPAPVPPQPRGALPPVARPPRPTSQIPAPMPPPGRPKVQAPDDDESTRMLDPRLAIAKTQPLPGSLVRAMAPTQLDDDAPPSSQVEDEATRTVDVGRIRAESAQAQGPGMRPVIARPDIGPPSSSNERTIMLDAAQTIPKPQAIVARPPTPSVEVEGPSSATQMKPLTAPVIRPPLPDRALPSWGEATQLGELPQRPTVDPLAATGNNPSMPRFVAPPMVLPSSLPQVQGAAANAPEDPNAAKKKHQKWFGPIGAGAIFAGYFVYVYVHTQNAQTLIDKSAIPVAPTTAVMPVTSGVVISQTQSQPAVLPQVINTAPTADPIVAPGSKNIKVVDAGVSDASTTVERAAVDALAQNNKARAEYFYEQLANAAPTNRAYVEAVRILRADLANVDAGP